MTQSQLIKFSEEHRKEEQRIWDDLKYKLVKKYMKEGYYQWWAESMADREILELRSKPVNVHPMPPQGEFHYLPNESLD